MDSTEERDRSRDRSRRDRGTRFSENSRDRSTDRGRDRASMKSSNCRVFVSNIPYEYRWQDLKDLFRTEVGDVQFVELFVDENDKSRGCGVVEFADPAHVKKCLEVMQRFEVKSRKLVIKEDVGNARDKYGSIVGGKRGRDRGDRFDAPVARRVGGGGGGDDVGKWGNTYGLSPEFLESLEIDVPLCNRVFVASLDYSVDKKKLKEVFRLAGKVQKVDLHTDKDGRSRGFAVVEYDHPVEAVQAISMFNNQFLYERAMIVRMDRVNDVTKLPEGLKGIGMGLGSNGEPLKDVARNLPSANPPMASGGAGILGAVPNQALQVASALSSLNAAGPFGGLNSGNNVLQTANLASNLMSNLGGADLSLANSLVSNPLQNLQTQNQFQNLNSNNMSSLASTGNNSSQFNRSDGYGTNNQNFGNSRAFSSNTFDSKPDGFNLNSNQLMRNAAPAPKSTGFSRKIIVSNLPPSASYKMLHDKFSEFGEVQHFEEKSTGTMLVLYGSEWQAERAIKNLDRARIDGRTIDARFFF